MEVTSILLIVGQIAIISCAPHLESDEIIDLTHVLDEKALGWPGNKPYILKTKRGPRNEANGFRLAWVETGYMSLDEHIGTHMDAPSHFIENAWRIDDIPPEQFIGPAVKISIRHQASKNVDYVLSVQDILDWEAKNGRIPNKAILFVDTGFAKYYNDRIKYSGAETVFDENQNLLLHYPGVSKEAAQFLVDKRDIVGLVVDAISLDSGQNSEEFPVHHILLGVKKWGVENCADMEKLPATGTIASVFPAKTRGSGAPTRILVMKTGLTISGSSRIYAPVALILTIFCLLMALMEF